jgi:beta-glucanase (GH16 family)
LGWGRTTDDWDFTFENANVYISNGKLILKADYHSVDVKPIHSGAITTKQSDFLYGYFEIRCKLNSFGIEYMPAFWVWNGDGCNWYNEIDFFETFAENPSDLNNITISGNMHWRSNSCDNTISYFDGSFKNNDVTSNFHTFGYEWSPDFVIFYFDGYPYRFLRNNHVANHGLRLVANLGFRGRPNTYPSFLGYMEIDWIKVYRLKMDTTSVINQCQFNPTTFNYSVKKTISIGGSGCSSSLSQNDKVTLRATDHITIIGDFTVP